MLLIQLTDKMIISLLLLFSQIMLFIAQFVVYFILYTGFIFYNYFIIWKQPIKTLCSRIIITSGNCYKNAKERLKKLHFENCAFFNVVRDTIYFPFWVHEMPKLATFQPMAYRPRIVSLLHLAEIGLQYDTESGTVYCSECSTSHDEDVALHPPEGYEYHAPGCSHRGSTVAVLPEGHTITENLLLETTSGSNTDYDNLFRKLFTYRDFQFPSPLYPLDLAKNGYCFVGPLNKVKCWDCGTTRLPHEEGVDNFLKYIYCFRCQPNARERENPGLFSLPSMRQEKYEDEFDCLVSFYKYVKQWPAHDMLQPFELSKWLYYYTGFEDIIACSVCEFRRFPSHEGIETFRAHMTCPKCDVHRTNSQLSSQGILEPATNEVLQEVSLDDVSTFGTTSSVQPANITLLADDSTEDEQNLKFSGNMPVLESSFYHRGHAMRHVGRHVILRRPMCPICGLASSSAIFLPCREKLFCLVCSIRFTQCPSCGRDMLKTIPLYSTINT